MKIKLKNSIRLKLFKQIAAIIIICALAVITCNALFLEDYYYRNVKKSLEAISDQIDGIDDYTDSENLQMLYELEISKSVNINIFDGEHNMLYDTSRSLNRPTPGRRDNIRGGGNAREPFENNRIVESRETNEHGGYFEERRSINGASEYLVYVNKLSNENIVEISHRKELISQSARLANGFIIPITVVVFSISIVWIFMYSKRFTKPLVDMSNITERMSQLDFSQKCRTSSEDEIGKLSTNINYLSDTLDETLSDLQAKNEQLLRDIEYERKLEERRKAFISNVSHELKTPISIIQGYAEGLKLGVSDDPEKLEKYCSVIMDETEKMNNLVLDLLTLSRYESGSFELPEEEFSVSKLVSVATAPLAMRMADNGIKYICEVPDDSVGYGNVEQLNKVVRNYVSNAISHAEGEKIIKITCKKLDNVYRLKVFNTGRHIPDVDMENIWLSFYRGDKSHNRDSNRFGLGLSIVKSISNIHGTECGAENTADGVEFWFDIKINK